MVVEYSTTSYPSRSSTLKAVLVGDSGVGKTTAWLSFERGYYHPKPWCDIKKDTVKRPLSDALAAAAGFSTSGASVQLWDTASQERFLGADMSRCYYRGASIVLVCYRVDSYSSYESATGRWLADVCKHFTGGEEVVACLVGLRSDLDESREVSTAEARWCAEEECGLMFAEVSSKAALHGEPGSLEHLIDICARQVLQHGDDARGRPPFGETRRFRPTMPKKGEVRIPAAVGGFPSKTTVGSGYCCVS